MYESWKLKIKKYRISVFGISIVISGLLYEIIGKEEKPLWMLGVYVLIALLIAEISEIVMVVKKRNLKYLKRFYYEIFHEDNELDEEEEVEL